MLAFVSLKNPHEKRHAPGAMGADAYSPPKSAAGIVAGSVSDLAGAWCRNAKPTSIANTKMTYFAFSARNK